MDPCSQDEQAVEDLGGNFIGIPFRFGLLAVAWVFWIMLGGGQALAMTEDECWAIKDREFEAGWTPPRSDKSRFVGFDVSIDMPNVIVRFPAGGGEVMVTESRYALNFRTQEDAYRARLKFGEVRAALDGLLRGFTVEEHCGAESHAQIMYREDRVVESILHPIPVRVIVRGRHTEWE